MVLRKASRASSWWFEGDIDVGSDTNRYLVPLDIFAGWDRGCRAWLQGSSMGDAMVEVSLVGLTELQAWGAKWR